MRGAAGAENDVTGAAEAMGAATGTETAATGVAETMGAAIMEATGVTGAAAMVDANSGTMFIHGFISAAQCTNTCHCGTTRNLY